MHQTTTTLYFLLHKLQIHNLNVYGTGVSYYLDGAASQANYLTNTTTFNAAGTRYIEVTPASDATFYYACYIHGIGMGGEIDITQNTWGALSWNSGQWGDQTDLI